VPEEVRGAIEGDGIRPVSEEMAHKGSGAPEGKDILAETRDAAEAAARMAVRWEAAAKQGLNLLVSTSDGSSAETTAATAGRAAKEAAKAAGILKQAESRIAELVAAQGSRSSRRRLEKPREAAIKAVQSAARSVMTALGIARSATELGVPGFDGREPVLEAWVGRIPEAIVHVFEERHGKVADMAATVPVERPRASADVMERKMDAAEGTAPDPPSAETCCGDELDLASFLEGDAWDVSHWIPAIGFGESGIALAGRNQDGQEPENGTRGKPRSSGNPRRMARRNGPSPKVGAEGAAVVTEALDSVTSPIARGEGCRDSVGIPDTDVAAPRCSGKGLNDSQAPGFQTEAPSCAGNGAGEEARRNVETNAATVDAVPLRQGAGDDGASPGVMNCDASSGEKAVLHGGAEAIGKAAEKAVGEECPLDGPDGAPHDVTREDMAGDGQTKGASVQDASEEDNRHETRSGGAFSAALSADGPGAMAAKPNVGIDMKDRNDTGAVMRPVDAAEGNGSVGARRDGPRGRSVRGTSGCRNHCSCKGFGQCRHDVHVRFGDGCTVTVGQGGTDPSMRMAWTPVIAVLLALLCGAAIVFMMDASSPPERPSLASVPEREGLREPLTIPDPVPAASGKPESSRNPGVPAAASQANNVLLEAKWTLDIPGQGIEPAGIVETLPGASSFPVATITSSLSATLGIPTVSSVMADGAVGAITGAEGVSGRPGQRPETIGIAAVPGIAEVPGIAAVPGIAPVPGTTPARQAGSRQAKATGKAKGKPSVAKTVSIPPSKAVDKAKGNVAPAAGSSPGRKGTAASGGSGANLAGIKGWKLVPSGRSGLAVEDAEGRLHALRVGDSLNGIRILAIDPDGGVMHTSAGTVQRNGG
jgi:hypothetical protein